MKKIVIDAMGGDNGSKIVVEAVKQFISENEDYECFVCGKKEELKELENICEVIDAREVVPMEAGPLEVMRLKDSSMNKAIQTLKEENADAVISCGSTGGFLSTATINLKNIPGISRSALVSPFPTKIKGKKVVILDIGASNENSPEELVQFAKMGSLYYKTVFGKNEPNVFLLSNGTEPGKGSPSSKAAYKLFESTQFPGFKGNIEARNALSGEADVVVTDGFTGNVFLKSSEGMAKMMSGMIKSAFKRNLWSKLGYLHVRKGIKDMTETMDYKSTGGAILLGVNGIVIKAHGSSDAYSFKCAMNVAKKMIDADIVNNIKKSME